MNAPERWAWVEGYPHYEISSHGRVRSYASGQPQIRRPSKDQHGYPQYSLWADGKGKNIRVHILVAAAFIGPRPAGLHIRHLDGDPTNPRVENLAYGTPRENALDTLRHGRNRQAAQTHCKNGHEYTPENTIRFGPERRYRDCRPCSIQRKRKYNARLREERKAA